MTPAIIAVLFVGCLLGCYRKNQVPSASAAHARLTRACMRAVARLLHMRGPPDVPHASSGLCHLILSLSLPLPLFLIVCVGPPSPPPYPLTPRGYAQELMATKRDRLKREAEDGSGSRRKLKELEMRAPHRLSEPPPRQLLKA